MVTDPHGLEDPAEHSPARCARPSSLVPLLLCVLVEKDCLKCCGLVCSPSEQIVCGRRSIG